MKLTDYIFWLLLGAVAIFYLTIGNGMYDEKQEMLEKKTFDINVTKKG